MVPVIITHKCRLAQIAELFRQRYSKVGNTREQLFYMWRSFNFDEKHRNHRCLCYPN